MHLVHSIRKCSQQATNLRKTHDWICMNDPRRVNEKTEKMKLFHENYTKKSTNIVDEFFYKTGRLPKNDQHLILYIPIPKYHVKIKICF